MYEWEREALGIDTLGKIRGNLRVRGRILPAMADPNGWWVAALYAPEVWRVWRVGLLRRPVRLQLIAPLALPQAAEFSLSRDVPAEVRADMADMATARVCPAIVAESALGFVVRCGADSDAASDALHVCDIYAPTGLRARLGLEAGAELALHILPAEEYLPHSRRQASRAD